MLPLQHLRDHVAAPSVGCPAQLVVTVCEGEDGKCAVFPSMAFPCRKAGFARIQRDMEYSSRSCNLPRRTHLQHVADMVHIALVCAKGDINTTFCLGWQQPNIASSPQHAEQPLWSETIYIHFCALVFSGTCVWCRKRQKNMQVLWIASKLK